MKFIGHNMLQTRRLHLIVCVVSSCLVVPVYTGAAQDHSSRPEDNSIASGEAVVDRHSFVLMGVPLEEALALLIDQTRIDLFFESELVDGKTTYCAIEQAGLEAVLRCILAGTTLDYYRLSTGVYVLTAGPLGAVAYGSVTGRVIDRQTLEPLPDASIMLADAATGTTTNEAGRFALRQLEPGLHPIVVSHVAYEAGVDSVWLSPGEHRDLEVVLQARTFESTPIIVNGLYERMPSAQLGKGELTAEALQRPGPSATPSTYEVLNDVVGVRIGDTFADLHVQGGDSGEHQHRLDGVPIFVPLRNGGFFGAFSPLAIEQITVHKAGFQASEGSFLSGAIEMDHAIASREKERIDVQVDPLSVNGRIQGQERFSESVRGSWMVAGRLGLWGLFQPAPVERRFRMWSQPGSFVSSVLSSGSRPGCSAEVERSPPLHIEFSDFHAATRLRFGATRSLYASLYQGSHAFGIGDRSSSTGSGEDREQDYSWLNTMRQVRYEWVQGQRGFMHVGFWSSSYRLEHPVDRSPFSSDTGLVELDDFDEIIETGISVGFDYAIGARHTLSGKLEPVLTESEFSLSIDPTGVSAPIDHHILAPARWYVQGFLEDVLALSDRSQLTLGARYTYVPAQQRLYAEPRLSWRYDRPDGPGGAWAFQAAAGLYRQFIYQFDVADYNASTLLPGFRFWIPIGKHMRASTAYHLASSVLFAPAEHWQLLVEGFYKYQPHLMVLDYAGSEGLLAARGYAYGSAVALKYETRAFRIQGHYEYDVARRQVNNRFGGAFVSVPWEAPHQTQLSIGYTLWEGLTATLRWQGIWGRSWAFRQAYYDYLEPLSEPNRSAADLFSHPERDVLPAYSRVDAGFGFARRLGRLRLQARVNAINLFDRKNELDWILEDDGGRLVRKARTAIPLFSSFSIRIRY